MFEDAVRGMVIDHLLRYASMHLLVAVAIFSALFVILGYRHLPRQKRKRIVLFAIGPAILYLIGVIAVLAVSAIGHAPEEIEIINIETPSASPQESGE